MSISYRTLGNICKTNHALTSNDKFINPDDKNYTKNYTNMMIYPGSNYVRMADSNIKNILRPNHIKSHETPNYYDQLNEHRVHCKSCNKN